jgi:hypothetical protein
VSLRPGIGQPDVVTETGTIRFPAGTESLLGPLMLMVGTLVTVSVNDWVTEPELLVAVKLNW